MPKEIYLVKVGMTMTEGMVSEWFIADGAEVKKGELLYALETEKVNLDVDAEADGTVKHTVEVGVMLEPGDVVGYIFEAGEAIPDDFAGVGVAGNAGSASEAEAAAPVAVAEAAAPAAQVVAAAPVRAPGERVFSSPAARRLAGELGVDYTQLAGSGPGGRVVEADVASAASSGVASAAATGASAPRAATAIADVKASPLARRLAAEKGVDLTRIAGTGPGGRIVQSDVESAAIGGGTIVSTPARAAPTVSAGTTIPVKGMRRTIAQRMKNSLETSAQLTMDMEVIMDDAVKLRESLIAEWQDEGVRPTYTDLVVKAAAKALQKHPMMNSVFSDTEITLLEEINIGIAVALPEGLVVPVIRDAIGRSVKEIAIESTRLAAAARDGKLGLDDYAGGTFTISALGMYGVDSFTPIINEPQSGIVGVNRIYDGMEWDGDRPVKTKKMNLSLTWDHRAVDGAPAAEFLAEMRELLANPFRLLV